MLILAKQGERGLSGRTCEDSQLDDCQFCLRQTPRLHRAEAVRLDPETKVVEDVR